MGLLDLFYNVGTQLNQIYNDYSTTYPSQYTTGTPTNTQNPGGPVDTFHQNYDGFDTYLDANDLYSGELKNTLEITNFDVEDPSVQGGPLSDTTTQYPSTITGTPTPFANPGGPLTNFSPPNNPNATFLNNYFQSRYRLYNTFYTTNLDVEHPGVQGGPVGDGTTSYPSTVTGTPTPFANPGGPLNWFYPNYTPHFQYIYNIPGNGNGKLRYTLDITNLDVQNPGVNGGPLGDTTTQYPSTVTGTPTTFANPGGPLTYFYPNYKPNYQYINNIPNGGIGELRYTLNITNLDVQNPGVSGGPLGDTTTNYPSTITGTPTTFANPGGPLTYFYPNYKPNYQYINNIPNGGDGELRYTLDITNFDVQNPGVSGGPARPIDDPTSYPQYVSGVPNNTQNPGGPVRKFKQIYKPNKEYINNIPNNGDGELWYTLDITNLDVENPSVLGGPVADNTTQYPQFSSGTPTIFINNLGSGPFNNSGAPPNRFGHPYHPHYTYLFNLPNGGSGVLANTLNITNLDVENPFVQGGPLGDYVTGYISQYVTGVPTSQSNYSIWNGGSGTGPKRFYPIYSPNNEYVAIGNHPPGFLASSNLINTLEITNLDIEKQGAFGGPNTDITTQYWQAPLTTGTPTSQSNFNLTSPFASGVPPKPFTHPWSNISTYLASNPIAINGSGKLKDTLAITNFDVENSSVMGGPLNDTNTIYPAANVTHTSPIRGWFAEPSQPPSNFNQLFTPTNTYENFIQAYT